jgi:penicillin-binding protein 1B
LAQPPGERFTLRFWLLVLGLVGLTAAAAATWWVVGAIRDLDQQLVERFSGRRWDLPSKFYSDSLVVVSGAEQPASELVERLERLNYRRVDGEVQHAGEYRFVPAERRLEIYLRPFAYSNHATPALGVALAFDGGGKVSAIRRLDGGDDVDSIELEPEILAGIYDRVWEERRVVHIDELPSTLVRAVLAAEDRRFFEHHGLDVRGIVRATIANFRSGHVVQGGSTLTQQLIKNFFLSGARTVKRKIVEAVMALLAESHYSKFQILETYLNEIYLGQRGARGIFGVWEGAQFYFGKEPKDLSLSETAMLAGLIRSPGKLAPARNPEPARRRRDEVLAAMLENGDVNREDYEHAVAEPLPDRLPAPETGEAPYFIDSLRAEIEAEYPLNTLASEGFRIFTTLDPALQRHAVRALTNGLAKLEKSRPSLAKKGEPLEGALLAIQPHTGEVRAMVGGRSYQTSQFNRVTQATRQPGSVFKPMVFLAAFEEEERNGGLRFVPTRRLEDTPFTWNYDGRTWSPENYKQEYHGAVSLRQALELSLNSATARVAQEVGLDPIRDVARRVGFADDLPAVPSIVLGSVEVTPLQVAQAFATIANLGFRTEAGSIRAVVDGEGNEIVRTGMRAAQAVSPRVAYLMTSLMEGVLDRGTGHSARAGGFRVPAAGKTGTTNEGRDAWFVGFTPDLLAVVWVGFDRGSTLGLSGAQAALPIWTEFMKAATAGHQPTPFLVPPGIETVTIDPLSGARATSRCPERVDESFLQGEAPQEFCPLHPEVGEAPSLPGAWPQ